MAESPRMLPVQPTPLVGRQREVQAVLELLTRAPSVRSEPAPSAATGQVRLVTLTGPGGTGKTRVGIEVAAGLLDQIGDGVEFVDLAAIDDATLFIPSVAECLGIRDTGRRPLLELVTEYLRPRHLLLLLDNFDRILPAATIVADLLGAFPDLKLLVTSRAPLQLRSEHEYPVPPLALPDPGLRLTVDELSRVPAVSLFVQRVTDIRPDFELTETNAETVREICRRLDGLPLAIELAAARVRLLSPEAMLGWLDRRLTLLSGGPRDLPERHRTLRDTIAWSYDLLGEDEQRLFRRMSVFVGGCTLEAADDVARDEGRESSHLRSPRTPHPSSLEGVASLIGFSLLRRSDGPGGDLRYAMLDTIREFGLEQLTLAGEDVSARRRHLAWGAGFAEYGETQVRGPDGQVWLDRLAAELDNVRAALNWSLADADDASTTAGLRLAGAFFPFWYFRSHLDEGRRWIQRLLAADRERSLSSGPADEPDDSIASADTISRSDDGGGWWFAIHPRVKALIGLCNLCQQLGRLQEAETAIEEAIAVAQRMNDQLGEARATHWLAIVARSSGDYERAVALFETSLSTFRRLDHAYGIWWTLNQFGETVMRVGELSRARLLLEQSVAVARTLGSLWGIADSTHRLGTVIFRQGDLDRATALLEESLAGYTTLRAHGLHTCLLDLGTIALARGEPGRAAAYLSQSLTRSHEIGDRNNCARSLEGLVQAFATIDGGEDRARLIDAARLLGAVAALREEINVTVAPVERPAIEQAESAIRAAIGDAAYDAQWGTGRALSLDQAVERALALASQLGTNGRPVDSTAGQPGAPVAAAASILTAREQEVAALIARGLRNRQIATSLVISERTVHVHVASILSKLGFKSRSQIAVWAVEHGLGPPSGR